MIPFRGVRISWLILARNSLLARLAISAASLSLIRASARFRSVMSLVTAWMPTIRPSPSTVMLTCVSPQNVLPSFRMCSSTSVSENPLPDRVFCFMRSLMIL